MALAGIARWSAKHLSKGNTFRSFHSESGARIDRGSHKIPVIQILAVSLGSSVRARLFTAAQEMWLLLKELAERWPEAEQDEYPPDELSVFRRRAGMRQLLKSEPSLPPQTGRSSGEPMGVVRAKRARKKLPNEDRHRLLSRWSRCKGALIDVLKSNIKHRLPCDRFQPQTGHPVRNIRSYRA